MRINPIICALDTIDPVKAVTLTAELKENVGAVKLGLEFFTANGAKGVQTVAEQGVPIFLDLKFHDIPNTVKGAIKATYSVSPFLMTVHTSGGYEMMRAAADAAKELGQSSGRERPFVVGVTVLTSMDEKDLYATGVKDSVSDHVKRLADLARQSGLDGVVCSPHEIAMLREHCGPEFLLVVPGIRPAGEATQDQKRVMTPKEAIDNGADYLVIGRPITGAVDPAKAAADILDSLIK